MKISVVHLRILAMAANLLLVVGLVVHYAYRVWVPPPVPAEAGVKVRPRELFEPTGEGRRLDASNTVARVGGLADYLTPSPPRTAPPPGSETGEDETEGIADEEEVTEGGPLAKDWEYVHIFYVPESPLDSKVTLRKKQAAPPTRSTSRYSSSRTRTITSRRTPTRSTSRTRSAGEQIILKVRNHWYKDEDMDLDFYVHSADTEKLVYKLADDFQASYSLKRVAPTKYEEAEGPEIHLGAKDEEEGDGKEDEEKKFFKRYDTRDVEDLREKEYQALIRGKKTAMNGVLEPSVPGRPRTTKVSSRTRTTRTTPTRTTPTRTTPTTKKPTATSTKGSEAKKSGPITDPAERAKAIKELKEKTKDYPKEARDEINKALRG